MHAVVTSYTNRGFRRKVATVRMSPRLPLDPRTMTGDEMTVVIRDAITELGDLTYVDQYAFIVKARAERAARKAADQA